MKIKINKYIQIILVVFVFLVAINYFINLAPSDTQTNTSDSVATDSELFDYKTECAQYKEKIEARIEVDNYSSGFVSILDQVFYSPIENSCLYSSTYFVDSSSLYYSSYSITDYLTNEFLYSDEYTEEGESIEENRARKELLDLEVLRLKGR